MANPRRSDRDTPYWHRCGYCGDRFLGRDERVEYCSPTCRGLARTSEPLLPRLWDCERVANALGEWALEHGRAPYPDELLEHHAGPGWPPPWIVSSLFDGWGNACRAAGLAPPPPRSPARRLVAMGAILKAREEAAA